MVHLLRFNLTDYLQFKQDEPYPSKNKHKLMVTLMLRKYGEKFEDSQARQICLKRKLVGWKWNWCE